MKLYELAAGAKFSLVEDTFSQGPTGKEFYKYFSINDDKYYVLDKNEHLVQIDPWREVVQL